MINIFLPAILSFLITLIFMPSLISYFRSKHEGQMIREEGPRWHEKKSGTPTMGGLLFILAIIIASIVNGIFMHNLNPTILILLFILFLYGLLGMWDDSIKLFRRQNEGLKAWQKLLGQIVGGVIFTWVYSQNFPMALRIPFYGDINMGWFYVIFVIFYLTGFSNAVNLADGLDGLVAGLSIISFAAYGIIAYCQSQIDVAIFCFAVVGGLLAFLIFNHKPAKIFMGDMGSLALGGSLAAVSILLHHELSLIWIGLVFVVETLSVMIQVTSFKLTGKRVFLMSPIHHHFEMLGWSEWKIDITFWLVALFTAITGIMFII
ncbi:phospho-N-acetylmuramoyl-pentapeptide-transferase [Apilactobacillus micheneri]|uniref:Phospho-N-acetylmuramoyl-pentapeptide-transferase n=1 Tax=Apilactobacillus micheneri TaxID=1899430 RepID=A0A9Q8IMP0_9LACO|nr:phospho-N-acetylmuramoyl-pentapeptide-transferase [Apilactobacillus micheneri]TPR40810.1 phospho-N-acetylmuramoyl-pentapeptide-transferase [Apilactobacillus micheneri]TPR42277.1 phospho-N-acetylmuramoyl-pentapeptide-transferase [Apilactobacillus micheneri]TPR44932.1 phospho-N-acetylmuramoyl-pentapeptide-transferase [Apilactobacillus micheneri]TPR45231.1 phospho-N-acetylmuramoyl-pentapeptide-transferase [Apilactobacillus micheneri]TPR46573.1 phospho-N-acetylmuramoyl-pentapeptide-transferase 